MFGDPCLAWKKSVAQSMTPFKDKLTIIYFCFLLERIKNCKCSAMDYRKWTSAIFAFSQAIMSKITAWH
jgi:hypothetical protein